LKDPRICSIDGASNVHWIGAPVLDIDAEFRRTFRRARCHGYSESAIEAAIAKARITAEQKERCGPKPINDDHALFNMDILVRNGLARRTAALKCAMDAGVPLHYLESATHRLDRKYKAKMSGGMRAIVQTRFTVGFEALTGCALARSVGRDDIDTLVESNM
jgi:hypothetical protein